MPILVSSDGACFNVSSEVAGMFGIIDTMMKTLDIDESGDNDKEPIPLSNVTGAIFEKVLEWAEKHKDDTEHPDAQELGQGDRRDKPLTDWDKKFFKNNKDAIFSLIMAANYLDIKGLLDDACIFVAKLLKKKSPSKIREMFNIKNDLTEAKHEKILKEVKNCYFRTKK